MNGEDHVREALNARSGRILAARLGKTERVLIEAGYLRDSSERVEREFSTALLDFLVDALHLAEQRQEKFDVVRLARLANDLHLKERRE